MTDEIHHCRQCSNTRRLEIGDCEVHHTYIGDFEVPPLGDCPVMCMQEITKTEYGQSKLQNKITELTKS